MDIETEEIILLLQLQDIEEALSQSKGKHREGEPPDVELALTSAKDELQELLQSCRDHRMALSLSRACATDQRIITAANAEEDAAIRDRTMAQSLSGRPSRPLAITAGPSTPVVDEADLRRFAAINGDATSPTISSVLSGLNRLAFLDDDDETNQGSSSSQRKGKEREPSTECPTCMTPVHKSDLYELVCHDVYCRNCISELFREATVVRKAYPPRCCRIPIPLEDVTHLLPTDLVTRFRAKAVEWDTENGTYCSEPTCSKFILPAYVGRDVATCPSCGSETCTKCKASAHKDECPEDPSFKALSELARGEEWQRCYQCGTVSVMLNSVTSAANAGKPADECNGGRTDLWKQLASALLEINLVTHSPKQQPSLELGSGWSNSMTANIGVMVGLGEDKEKVARQTARSARL